MSPLDPTLVEALLEERPYASSEIAELLEQPTDPVHRFLLGLQREGRLKRVGARQLWALPSHVGQVGHPHVMPRDQVRALIRHVLAGTTLATQDLVLRTGINRHIVKDECRAMRERGELEAFGRARGSRWRLPGTAPAAEDPDRESPIAARIADEAITCEAEAAAARLGRRRVKPPRPAPRQPHPRPPKATVTAAPSWWIGLSREELERKAQERAVAMSASQVNRYVHARTISE